MVVPRCPAAALRTPSLSLVADLDLHRTAAPRRLVRRPEIVGPKRHIDNAPRPTNPQQLLEAAFRISHPLFAREVNVFARDVLSPYLNFHRPCLFPTEITDRRGRTRKRYRYQDVMTPFEKLKSLPHVEQCLRPGVTISALENQAKAMSDLKAAAALNRARGRLFDLINRESDPHRRRSA